MKRYRAKAVGLGLALLAGQLRPATAQPPAVPPVPAAPAILPASVRNPDWAAPAAAPVDTVWLPARKPAATAVPPSVTPPPAFSALPPVVPPVTPPVVTPAKGTEPGEVEAATLTGPRANPTTPLAGPLPEIPPVPDAVPPVPVPLPTMPAEPLVIPQPPAEQPQPPADGREWRAVSQPSPFGATTPEPAAPTRTELPAPEPFVAAVAQPLPTVMPARPMRTQDVAPPPRPLTPADPLPTPRPTPSPAQPMPETGGKEPAPESRFPMNATWGIGPAGAELPVAPPELMIPPGVPVPGKHGTFGSAPIRLSRDYPPLTDMVHPGGPGGEPGGPALDRFFFRAEYLMWWVRTQNIPVLATTSVNGGLGFLGDPGTRTLLGPGPYGDPLRHGLRVRGGWWWDEAGSCGVDGSFFFLGRQTTTTSFDSNTTPTITRPFFSPNLGTEFGERVARPGFSQGTLDVTASSTLWGFDTNLRHALCKTCDFRNEVFAGYRFLGLNESLTVTENILAVAGNPVDPAGTRIRVQDRFETRNRFNGGQVGYAAERNWGRLSVDARASVGLGATHQEVTIVGDQVRLRPGMATPDVFPNGGLLAAGPNLGTFTRDRFSVVPEVSFNLGYWVTPTVKAYVGYNFLYWSNVVRPGDQIDRVVDVSFIPNPPTDMAGNVPPFSGQLRPQPTFQQTDLWVNGIQFGMEWRW